LRIGTWNLEGRWGDDHLAFLLALDCDVLLLTEVSERLVVPGHALHLGTAVMAARRRWAGILVRGDDLEPLPDPHPASAMAASRGWCFCSSILPWKASGGGEPRVGDRHADRTGATIDTLLRSLPAKDLIWGGDWNHALTGREYAGSIGGRAHVTEAIHRLGVRVPTQELAHRIPELLTIDHIAVPARLPVVSAAQHRAEAHGKRLSDHDAYVVEVADSVTR
jgi:hypothetical protein